MQTLCVYIVQCTDGSYYCGLTNNLERRLWEHNTGQNPHAYTYKRRPVALVFIEHFQSEKQAIAFEKQIKKWRRAKKEALIQRDWIKLQRLSKNYQSILRQAQDDPTSSG
jgi:putative endonuclease